MLFNTGAVLICIECGQSKTVSVEADIVAVSIADAKTVRDWQQDIISLKPLEFESICPNCKYNKAA